MASRNEECAQYDELEHVCRYEFGKLIDLLLYNCLIK